MNRLTTFKMNTCKSVSKQRTLSTCRMNTYAKTGCGGPTPFPTFSLESLMCWYTLLRLRRTVAAKDILNPPPRSADDPQDESCRYCRNAIAGAYPRRPARPGKRNQNPRERKTCRANTSASQRRIFLHRPLHQNQRPNHSLQSRRANHNAQERKGRAASPDLFHFLLPHRQQRSRAAHLLHLQRRPRLGFGLAAHGRLRPPPRAHRQRRIHSASAV